MKPSSIQGRPRNQCGPCSILPPAAMAKSRSPPARPFRSPFWSREKVIRTIPVQRKTRSGTSHPVSERIGVTGSTKRPWTSRAFCQCQTANAGRPRGRRSCSPLAGRALPARGRAMLREQMGPPKTPRFLR